ncbi:MAG: DUF86 domain-containing protein [Anaerolineae bacterium]|nr:DUF86 domain-containing protein [Anaerolineae bacterium]
MDEQTYLTDPLLQAAIERHLQVISQIVLDVGTHIIAEQGWEGPEIYQDVIEILSHHGVISQSLAGRLRGMAGFRNVLVHEYLEIDPRIVYEVATQRLDDYLQFAHEIAGWVDRTEER